MTIDVSAGLPKIRVLLSVALVSWALGGASAAPNPAPAATNSNLASRGEYLARAGDCVACHTAPGGKPFAGGLYMSTPFGEISTPNLTPDKSTGIGAWDDDSFYRALHEGIGLHGEYLYPVFPFPWYTNVTREDALAIKAYLFSLPPENAPRKPLKFAFPFNVREGLLAWRTLFFKAKTFVPDPSQSPEVNRGAYLVEGLGHCGECHNRRNVLGASNWSGKLEGGEIEGWYAPNITSDGREGVGHWSEDQIVTFLKSGAAPGKGVALGPMAETINDSLRYLSDPDLHAMAAYLKSVAAKEPDKVVLPNEVASAKDAHAYLTHCASCHQTDGKGVQGMIPALAGNGALTATGPENAIRAVLGGLPATHDLGPMPAIGQAMSDEDIAAAINYARSAWGNTAAPNAGPGLVADLRRQTQSMLAGNLTKGCPPIGDPALTQAITAGNVATRLKNVDYANMLDPIDAILPVVKSSDPNASDDAIVNGLTAAYCPLAEAQAKGAAATRAELIGNFSTLVYGQIKKGAMRP